METPVCVSEPEVTLGLAPRTLGLTLVAVLVLAVDELNPVKVVCSTMREVFPNMQESHVAVCATVLLCLLVHSRRSHLLYYACRLFFRCTFNNMFFRSVEIVGAENLPVRGPVILTGNHNNQFVDAIFLLTNSHREISFMIAQKSWDRPLVGFLARAFHCIPVSRPQDVAFKGAGKVVTDGSATLRGEGTRFVKEVVPGSQLEIEGREKPVKVKAVTSDCELELESAAVPQEGSFKYKVLPKIDQSKMYDAVYRALKGGKCLGVFPEGGSHDRTDLLPLKAGVAIIALDAHIKHSIEVPIVPVGLNYFQGHRFGGRVVVEFGLPIRIPESIYALAEQDKHAATASLLHMVSTGMRSTIVPTPDYAFLQQIYMARRLYMREGVKLSTSRAMDVNRRFAVAGVKLAQLAGGRARSPSKERTTTPTTMGMLPEEATGDSVVAGDSIVLTEEEKDEFFSIKKDLEQYMSDLKALGVRDHQVGQIGWWSFKDLFSHLIWLLATMGLGLIPNVLFNLPVVAISCRLAAIEQEKSLKASSVKLAARDVVMSYKIIYVLVLIPVMYVFYGSLMFFLTNWHKKTIVLVLLSLPSFAFLGMKATEQGVRTQADLAPMWRFLLPGSAKEYERLPRQRQALQRRLSQAVKKWGPRFGELYYAKDVDWSKEMESYSSEMDGAVEHTPSARQQELTSPHLRRRVSSIN